MLLNISNSDKGFGIALRKIKHIYWFYLEIT